MKRISTWKKAAVASLVAIQFGAAGAASNTACKLELNARDGLYVTYRPLSLSAGNKTTNMIRVQIFGDFPPYKVEYLTAADRWRASGDLPNSFEFGTFNAGIVQVKITDKSLCVVIKELQIRLATTLTATVPANTMIVGDVSGSSGKYSFAGFASDANGNPVTFRDAKGKLVPFWVEPYSDTQNPTGMTFFSGPPGTRIRISVTAPGIPFATDFITTSVGR